MTTYNKPIPVPSPSTEFFWTGVKEHQLLLQQCDKCSAYRFPPSPICPECLSSDYTVKPVSGKGTVFTFGVYHRLYNPAFEEDLPYTVGMIELEEGPRLVSNVVGIAPDDVYCGMPVEVTFDDITDDATLYKFKPAG